MATTKNMTAITQVTATGNSTDLDISTAYRATLFIEHLNPTATITVGAQIDVRVKPASGSWYVLTTIICSLVAEEITTYVVDLPDGAAGVDLDYTAATTSGSGPTLDAEVGRITAV